MSFFAHKKDKTALIKTLSTIASNLSSGWFGLILIAPNFLPIKGFSEIFLLTVNMVFGIVFLWIAYKLERHLL